MSPISSIPSSAAYTPQAVSISPKTKGTTEADAPASPANDPVRQTAASSQASPSATTYRNSFGDTVTLSGIVTKDRDGDGGVGLPASKPKAS